MWKTWSITKNKSLEIVLDKPNHFVYFDICSSQFELFGLNKENMERYFGQLSDLEDIKNQKVPLCRNCHYQKYLKNKKN